MDPELIFRAQPRGSNDPEGDSLSQLHVSARALGLDRDRVRADYRHNHLATTGSMMNTGPLTLTDFALAALAALALSTLILVMR